MTREKMTQKLIEKRVNNICDYGAEIWIEARLRYGMDWKPYYDMTNEEISEEYFEAFADEEDAA